MTLTALERAFELAASGKYRQVADIKRVVKSEGYDQSQVVGQSLFRQLKIIMEKAAPVL